MVRVLATIFVTAGITFSLEGLALNDKTRKLIERAGNGEETERVAILKQIADSNSDDVLLKTDARRLLDVAERWADLTSWLQNLPDKMPATDSCD